MKNKYAVSGKRLPPAAKTLFVKRVLDSQKLFIGVWTGNDGYRSGEKENV